MKLAITVDVEEEGLFSGRYPRVPPGVANVAQLARLEFITREFGFPLTLLATYPVVRDAAACRVLADWLDRLGAEIGLHLHPWNAPPFFDNAAPEPVRAENLPTEILRGKLASLAAQVRQSLGVTARSFRMGRFDGSRKILALLPEVGITVDSSMTPLTQKRGGPDHFLIPRDPFFLEAGNPPQPPLLEVPLTLVPIMPGTPELIYRLSQKTPERAGAYLRERFRWLGAVGIQPAWYPPASMRLAARLHRARGGRVLTMFFHSSELQPGATRLFPTEEAVAGLVGKIRAFLTWLVKTGPVQGVTLEGLYGAYTSRAVPVCSL
jgi:hypothetical protein